MMDHEDVIAVPFEVLDEVLATDEIAVEDEDTFGRWVAQVIGLCSTDCRDLVKDLRVANLSSEVIVELCSCEEGDAPTLAGESRRSRSTRGFPGRRFMSTDAEVRGSCRRQSGDHLLRRQVLHRGSRPVAAQARGDADSPRSSI